MIPIDSPLYLPGVHVTKVYDSTPAHKLGVREGDDIVSVQGLMVSTGFDIQESLRCFELGTFLRAHWIRDGSLLWNEIKIESFPNDGRKFGVDLGGWSDRIIIRSMGSSTGTKGFSSFQKAMMTFEDVQIAHAERKLKVGLVTGFSIGAVATLALVALASAVRARRAQLAEAQQS